MMNMKTDSIIFDLDGTLWDSTEQVHKVWNDLLVKKDIKKEITLKEFKNCMGLQLKEIGEKLFPELEEEFRSQLMKEACDIQCGYLEKTGGVLYDNLEDTLKTLSEKYKLFIVSNCQNGYIECFLKAHKLKKYFIDFECPGRTNLSKGENIKLIIKRNSLKNPVYVGDTDGDANAAKIAEIPFIYAKYGFGDVKKYDYHINKFDELITVL